MVQATRPRPNPYALFARCFGGSRALRADALRAGAAPSETRGEGYGPGRGIASLCGRSRGLRQLGVILV